MNHIKCFVSVSQTNTCIFLTLIKVLLRPLNLTTDWMQTVDSGVPVLDFLHWSSTSNDSQRNTVQAQRILMHKNNENVTSLYTNPEDCLSWQFQDEAMMLSCSLVISNLKTSPAFWFVPLKNLQSMTFHNNNHFLLSAGDKVKLFLKYPK